MLIASLIQKSFKLTDFPARWSHVLETHITALYLDAIINLRSGLIILYTVATTEIAATLRLSYALSLAFSPTACLKSRYAPVATNSFTQLLHVVY